MSAVPPRATCTNTGHPAGRPGVIVKETDKFVYRDLTCPRCGRSQGIRRIVKEHLA